MESESLYETPISQSKNIPRNCIMSKLKGGKYTPFN